MGSVSYGQAYQQTYSDTGFSESSVFAYLDRRVSFHTLAGSLSSNSCSAALICVFCATRRIRSKKSDEFAFLFQTFFRSDPPKKNKKNTRLKALDEIYNIYALLHLGTPS